MFKKIILIASFILFLTVILYGYLRRPQDIIATLIPETIQCVSKMNEDDYFSVDLYINQKHSYIAKADNIMQAYITDKQQLNTYPITVNNIIALEKVRISQQSFYRHSFLVSLRYQSYQPLKLTDAYLFIRYYDTQELNVYIGSFFVQKIPEISTNDISIHYLKGIVNPYHDKLTLVGIIMGLRNESNNDILIKNITLLDAASYIQNITPIHHIDIASQTPIIELTRKPYTIQNEKQTMDYFSLDDMPYVLLTIGYNHHVEMNEVGFRIEYSVNTKPYVYFYQPFTFYNNHQRQVFIHNLVMYTYGVR